LRSAGGRTEPGVGATVTSSWPHRREPSCNNDVRRDDLGVACVKRMPGQAEARTGPGTERAAGPVVVPRTPGVLYGGDRGRVWSSAYQSGDINDVGCGCANQSGDINDVGWGCGNQSGDISDVGWGRANQSGERSIIPGRMIAPLAGLPRKVAGATIS
jgi:hypothetical protein